MSILDFLLLMAVLCGLYVSGGIILTDEIREARDTIIEECGR